MSNFDELVRSEASKKQDLDRAEEERRKRADLLAGLDARPKDTLPAPHAMHDGRRAGAANVNNDGYTSAATVGVAGSSTAGATAGHGASSSSSSALIRGNSSLTPLEDAGFMIEETGIAMSMCGFGKSTGEGISQQLFAFAGLHPPSEESFDKFFRNWFEEEHFPVMSEELKRELVRRASSKGFFAGLSSQVKKWTMANTDTRLQVDIWYAYFMKIAPPTYKTYGCMRVASMNLGSVAFPHIIRFYGLPAKPDSKDSADQWVVMPWISHDVNTSAVLDELDGRGGLTALVAAAA